MKFLGAIISLENLCKIAALRHETYCLVAPRALAARLDDREISASERERMQRLRFKKGRDRFLVAHTLTRRILACLMRRDPTSIEMTLGNEGKPMLKNAALHFNVSYTDDWIALIVTSRGPVGIDVEYPVPCPAGTGTDPDMSSYKELPVGMVMNPADRFLPCPDDPAERFYICWTLKEAISKADGRGLNLAFDTIRLTPHGDGLYRGDDGAHTWHARHFQLVDGTHLAHACKVPLDPLYAAIM